MFLSPPKTHRSIFLAPALLGLLAACAQPAPPPNPRLSTEGAHSLTVGSELTITASTDDGLAPDIYTFTSPKPEVATVDLEGVVHAVGAGEVDIEVLGFPSGARNFHTVVVIPVQQPDVDDSIPYVDAWQGSAHADHTAEAFRHWDEDGEIPQSCARCHSDEGYRDFLGADGTAPGTVESPAPLGSVVNCSTCHNSGATTLTEVSFPSGATVKNLGPEARCIVCHQGRSSTEDVQASITESGVDPDTIDGELGFTNIHYYPAAATLFAGAVKGGYQYDGQVYDTRFRHVEKFNSCVECHDAHSLEVRFEGCQSCHAGVTDADSAHDIRMIASFNQDYDGDGDTEEGIFYEIETLRTKLLDAILQYGAQTASWICYDKNAYPYWFVDTDENGECNGTEAGYPNRYVSFTPRLLKATYNYQMAAKEPGAFAHNAKYIIELLHDSLVDLNQGLVVPLDLSKLVRSDTGHFDGSGEAARHWDENDEVQASCSKCHSGAPGFRFYVEYGAGLDVLESANGLECNTCHTDTEDAFSVLNVESVAFPGGTTLELPGEDNLCSTCHSGRASKATIDARIASFNFGFLNVHYLPAAGTVNGTHAEVGYEFSGFDYAGRMKHQGGSQCTTCHDAQDSNHTFRIDDVWQVRCDICHGDFDDAQSVRIQHDLDYDGDGNANEPLSAELSDLATMLLDTIHASSGNEVCYDAHAYPYWFKDTDSSGAECDPAEGIYPNRYTSWTPDLMRTTHNYQLWSKEPGAWAHNFDYTAQLLIDSIAILGGDTSSLERPDRVDTGETEIEK